MKKKNSTLGYMLIWMIWLVSDLEVHAESEEKKGERWITDNVRMTQGER